MVGLDAGLSSKHDMETSMIEINLSCTLRDGVESRGSNISSSAMFKFEDNEEQIEEIKSLGCFPFITSNANTPKLYTSHFSVTFIVYASSEEKNK